MLTPRVVAIVLNWNNLPDTLDCLASLAASTYPALSVVLVDNASIEDPSDVVRARFPAVEVLRQPRNLGYAGGNNAGIRWALANRNPQYVLLLNNDAVVAPDTIGTLVGVADKHHDAGFVTPKIFVDGTDDIYWSGGTVDWVNAEVFHDSTPLPRIGSDVLESRWSNGCAPLIRAAMVGEIGLMDEDLFLYFEDLAWSERARRAGWRHLVSLNSACWHKVSRTTGGVYTPLGHYYHARNRFRILGRYGATRWRFEWVLNYLLRIARDYEWRRADHAARRAIVEGFVDAMLGRWGQRRSWHRGVSIACDGVVYGTTTIGFGLVRTWRRVAASRPAN